jgi:hypothetical protein
MIRYLILIFLLIAATAHGEADTEWKLRQCQCNYLDLRIKYHQVFVDQIEEIVSNALVRNATDQRDVDQLLYSQEFFKRAIEEDKQEYKKCEVE